MTATQVVPEVTVKKTPRGHAIVVATDGTEASTEALSVAALVQARSGQPVHVLSVVEPLPTIMPFDASGMPLPQSWDEERSAFQKTRALEQIGATSLEKWTIDVRFGRPSEVVVEFARAQNAGLIVVGANHHSLLGRVLGEETAAEIARLTSIPLLVAAPMKDLPHHIIVALGLTSTDSSLLPAALGEVADAQSASVLHVKPRADFLGVDWVEYDTEYDLVMLNRYKEVSALLEAARINSDLIVRSGDPARELLAHLDSAKADLVVVGVRRRPGLRHSVGGRFAARLIRASKCSVLVIPQSPATASRQSTLEFEDPYLWSEALRGFTERNAARMASLEVDDPSLGSYVESSEYPFRGADYDRKNEVVTISMGLEDSTEGHLTRSIYQPDSVSILKTGNKDTALMVSKGLEKTLLILKAPGA